MDVCTHRFDAHAIAIIQVRDTPELILTNDVVVFVKTLIVFAANLGEWTYEVDIWGSFCFWLSNVCSSYWLFNDACILYRNAECLLILIHLEEHRSAGRDFALFATLKGDAFIIIVNTCETIELTFCFHALVNGERQAERSPGRTFRDNSAVRCILGCELVISHEILAVVKNKILRSKSFSRCTYLLLTILTYQLGEIASRVISVGFVGLVWVTDIIYKTFEILATKEHTITIKNPVRNKLIAGEDSLESWANREHKGHLLHALCIEIREVKRREFFTAPKHVWHIRHLFCIEVRDVERGKRIAAIEHPAHVRHILGIQILNTYNFGQIIAIIEPPITARWSCIGKRSIEDYLLDIFFLGIPPQIVRFHIKVISSCRLYSLVAECKSSSSIVKLSISTSRSKITIRAAVGFFVVDHATIKAFEVCAVWEHIRTIFYFCCNKLIAGVDGCKSGACIEHAVHIPHLLCIEIREVERSESWATKEHAHHILHLLCIEIRKIERREFLTTIEHIAHIRHLLCIELREIERSESWAAPEHVAHILHLLCFEIREVERWESGAITEHFYHTLHLLCIELREIERREFFTIKEHTWHILHIRCIQIFKAWNCFQCTAARKEMFQRCRCICFETLIENDILDICSFYIVHIFHHRFVIHYN